MLPRSPGLPSAACAAVKALAPGLCPFQAFPGLPFTSLSVKPTIKTGGVWHALVLAGLSAMLVARWACLATHMVHDAPGLAIGREDQSSGIRGWAEPAALSVRQSCCWPCPHRRSASSPSLARRFWASASRVSRSCFCLASACSAACRRPVKMQCKQATHSIVGSVACNPDRHRCWCAQARH